MLAKLLSNNIWKGFFYIGLIKIIIYNYKYNMYLCAKKKMSRVALKVKNYSSDELKALLTQVAARAC
ncbi:hypothetical protein B0A58_04335 [Flavobacterium branchiophilum NBRC 15030 = ATCC 35035]|nr:hypothetical protein B0A58_04335 [Flavobacterium branchiophilum NBRC 15030 = ATCC 35035]GEM55318.1 hypothetical protein FB1_15390 [Flavobacterium branchiophilum NBRC 15030 = ATCC 35035]